jgi:hypothetical protein
MSSKGTALRPSTLEQQVGAAILLVRGARVLLDADLAEMYGVSTKTLVQAVTRNRARFPADFMFQLTPAEYSNLRSQFVTSRLWGGRRYRPCGVRRHP